MPSTLGYALLGLLARQPRTGYELTQALRAPIGYFWTASHSQVYPELARLQAQRMVTHRVIAGPGPRDTKNYSITATGRRALAQWAVQPPEPTPMRDEFLLKIYSLWTADPRRARHLVATTRDIHVATLAHYQQIQQALRDESTQALTDPSTPQFSAYATLRRGLSFEAHALAWCDWLLDALAGDTTQQPQAKIP